MQDSRQARALTKAPINRIVPFSAVDGVGNRTAIFTQGCPYHCTYCHNPETIHACVHCGRCVSACPTGALTVREGKVVYAAERCVLCDACIRTCTHMSCPRIQWMDADGIMREVRKNVPFIRGITVSGGECTLHRRFLLELSAAAHAEGLSVLLDSNGSHDFSKDPELLDAIDGVMLDVKEWDEERHTALTGFSSEMPKKNLAALLRARKLAEVRTVVLSEGTAPEATVRNVAAALSLSGQPDVNYKLIAFRPMGVRAPYNRMATPSAERMRALSALAAQAGLKHITII